MTDMTPPERLQGVTLAERLLPCPWCGQEMELPALVLEGSTFRWRKVSGCCADGPEIRHDTMADDQAAAEIESRAAAIAAWNTRPEAAAALSVRGDFHQRFTSAANAICAAYRRETGGQMQLRLAEQLAYDALKAAEPPATPPSEG